MASTFPAWVFDNSPIPDPFGYGDRAVRFLRALCHPSSNAPKRKFELHTFQERIVRAIEGPRDADGNRIVRDAFFMIGRGNRKTTLAASMALLHLLGPERVPNGQIIFAAGDREQAATGFREAADIVRMMPTLSRATKIYDAFNSAKMIRSSLDGSTLKAVSSDGRTQHGTTPTFVLVDEIHSWRANGRELWQALETGLAKRPGGLMVTCTTAGRGREGLAAERYAYARKVASGEIIDPSFLPVLFEMQDDDDWTDEQVWHRCNPGLSLGFQDLGKLRIAAKRAENDLSAMYDFQQYHLCRWLGNSTAPLFNFDEYDASAFPVELDQHGKPEDWEADLEDLPCYLGIDYAQSGDLAAIVAAWRHDDGAVTIKSWFFVPSEGLEDRARLEGLPYREWIDAGHVIEVEGPVITPEAVADQVREICGRHDVQEAAFDPWKFRRMATELLGDGVPMLEMRQGPATMGPANGELIRAVNGRLIRHDGHPVLRHHFASVAAKMNDTGMVWMTKADPKRGHIDGAIAASMAVSRALTAHETRSRYENENVLGLTIL